MLLRNYTDGDLDQIAELEKKAFPIGAYSKPLLRKIFNTNKSFNFVLEVDGKITGYAVAMALDKYSADLESIAVDPECQNSGYGSILLKAIEAEMKKRGYIYSILEVRDRNYESISFYKKHGYEEIEYLPNYYYMDFRGSRGAYRFKKDL